MRPIAKATAYRPLRACLPAGLFSAVLVACGGGGGAGDNSLSPTATRLTGYVVDAPVHGIGYACGLLTGTTGTDGSFQYDSGATCTFRIGNVTIGAIPTVPSDGVVTPHDLAGVSRADTLNTNAVAIAQFLQSLDDGTRSGNITIPAAVATALAGVAPTIVSAGNVALSQSQLSTLVSTATNNGKSLVPASVAGANLRTFLQTAYPNLDPNLGVARSATSSAPINGLVITPDVPAPSSSTGSSSNPAALPATSVQLLSSASSIGLGEAITLTWTIPPGATGCVASDAWAGALSASGSKLIAPNTSGTSTYTIICPTLTPASTQVTVLGNSVADLSTRNIRGILSNAGTWTPLNASNPTTHNSINVANVFYSQIALANGRNGLVLTGWAYDGWDNTIHYPVNTAIFEQNADGTLTLASGKYLTDSTTNGAGSVVVADFNGDGKQDIFLAAHNESPMVAKPSTAYLSNSNGTFDKITLNDRLMAHATSLAVLNGVPTIFTMGWDGDPNPYYQYLNGQFVQTPIWNGRSDSTTQGFHYSTIGTDAGAVGDLSGRGQPDIAVGDFGYGPGYPYASGKSATAVYSLSDMINNTGAPKVVLTPYFNGKAEYANTQGLSGLGQTHTYRVWIDDFNHDGKPDILAGTSLWPSTYSMLQMFQNTTSGGVMGFVDKTDALNSGYNVKSQEVDYSMQLLDIDNSGIKAYFLAGSMPWPMTNGIVDNSVQANYILLNDGTGRLHVYMHDQFQNIGSQVATYFSAERGYTWSYKWQPRFISYLTVDNKINFVAVTTDTQSVAGNKVGTQQYINVPLNLNPTVDFKENITIADRNGSLRIRTWAGDDTIAGGCPSTCSIDGGFGTNTILYAGKRGNYTIAKTSTGFSVKDNVGGDGFDNIKNIQLLKFADATADLRTGNF